jgi:hemolysin type calcium-binding protein
MHRPIPAGPRRRTRRAMLAAALPAALAAAALTAAAAQAAADVTAVGTEIVVEDRTGRLGNEQNRLVAESLPGGELRLVDQVGLVAKAAGCFQLSQLEVRCVRPASSPISRLIFRGRGGGDRLTMLGSLPVRYEGGSGDDAYVAATRPGVPTAVDFSGGGDLGDLADYTRAEEGIDVRKNDLPNDGRTTVGDKDNIRTDVTIVRGTRFRDILHGQNRFVTAETLEPQGGNDFVLGISGITTVDMGAAPDGADKILGSLGTIVSYAKRTNPIRAAVDLDGADDGEAGERDELLQVGSVTGGSAGDTMLTRLNRIDGVGIGFDGGPDDDTISGTDGRDFLTGGPGTDTLKAFGSVDQLFSNDSEPGDRLFCGAGGDTATTDAVEATVSECETRTVVGTLRLAPTRLQATAGETAHLRLSWRHPQSWRKLRAIELRLTQAGAEVGEVTIQPRGGRISDRGAVEVMRKPTQLTRKGKTVTARLAVRLDKSLAGQTLNADVEATDRRGRRQLERDAATVHVAH